MSSPFDFFAGVGAVFVAIAVSLRGVDVRGASASTIMAGGHCVHLQPLLGCISVAARVLVPTLRVGTRCLHRSAVRSLAAATRPRTVRDAERPGQCVPTQ